MEKIYIIFEGCEWEGDWPLNDYVAYNNLKGAFIAAEKYAEDIGYTRDESEGDGDYVWREGSNYIYITTFDVVVR